MAGVSRLQYSTEARLIRVMCSGRVDLKFVIRALINGMDGVFIGACHLNECNYITHGNFDALNMVLLCRRILEHIGLNPERLRIEFMSGGEGNVFARVIQDFGARVKELGPLGQGEGLEQEEVQRRLEAVDHLAPYLKLVLAQRLKASFRSEQAYREFAHSQELDRLFQELVADKLALSQIMRLLQDQPLPTADISDRLGLSPSDVSRYMRLSSRQGLVRYDLDSKCYALA